MGLFSSKKPEARQYYLREKLLRCMHCSHDLFHERKSVLPMPPASLGDWSQRHANCYECADCGFIHWFADKDSKW
jgi:hypothetical protein